MLSLFDPNRQEIIASHETGMSKPIINLYFEEEPGIDPKVLINTIDTISLFEIDSECSIRLVLKKTLINEKINCCLLISNHLVVGTWNRLRLFACDTQLEEATIDDAHQGHVAGLCLCRENVFASVGQDGLVKLWCIDEGEESESNKLLRSLSSVDTLDALFDGIPHA